MQSSGAGGSDGSADDEGSPSEVSLSCIILLSIPYENDKQLLVIFLSVDHKGNL